MAAFRPSLNQQEVENLEQVIKPLFRSITLNDHRRIHILFQDFKLYYELTECEHKLACVLDTDKEQQLKERLAVLKPKWDFVAHIYKDDLWKAFVHLHSFIIRYSFKGLVREFGFTFWLRTEPSDVSYYDFTR